MTSKFDTIVLTAALRRFARDEKGLSAVEAALVFPFMLLLLLGVFDMGNAILINTKTLRASQIVADLITRSSVVTDEELDEAIEAGRLALEPFDTSSYGVDIVSISFDDEAAPEIEWRETRNMGPDNNVLDDVEPLAEEGQGVVVVNVHYDFEPFFAGFVMDAFGMQETAFARGRRSAVVGRI